MAQRELDEAVEYYNTESPGLGDQFLIEVLRTLERIRQYPEAWHPFTQHTRRCQTRRFLYGVVHYILESELLFITIAHLHWAPGYWRDRI